MRLDVFRAYVVNRRCQPGCREARSKSRLVRRAISNSTRRICTSAVKDLTQRRITPLPSKSDGVIPTTDMIAKPFDRCGLASADDFETPRWRELFSNLEAVQTDFLAHESEFRSGGYAWERDPLHGWSRSWEYPYHYHHLTEWRHAQANAVPTVVDLGSGVTFFPFAVARTGCSVVCVDPDPVAKEEVERAAAVVSAAPGSVSFAAGDCAAIPLSDGAADAVYCISVLEHVDGPERAVPEVARVLRSGGLFVLTIDIDLRGNMAIGPAKYDELMRLLRAQFDWAMPETTVHPRRMLDGFQGPYARAHQTQVPGIMWRAADGDLKPIVGGPIAADPMQLTVYAAVLRKR